MNRSVRRSVTVFDCPLPCEFGRPRKRSAAIVLPYVRRFRHHRSASHLMTAGIAARYVAFRYFSVLIATVAFLLFPVLGPATALEAGTAITNPALLEKIERQGFGIGALLARYGGISQSATAGGLRIANSDLFANRSLRVVIDKLSEDLGKARDNSLEPRVQQTIPASGDDEKYRSQFRVSLLRDKNSGWELSGIVNRMDRAYLNPESCGEIRFIYRFVYRIDTSRGELDSRLPLTLNLVLTARAPAYRQSVSCQALAQNWMRIQDGMGSGDADKALDVLKDLRFAELHKIETNIQVFRLRAGHAPDFGTYAEYLMRVFEWDKKRKNLFTLQILENQVDRQLLMSDQPLRRRLLNWLMRPANLERLDQGTIRIPDGFLATKAISVAPGGHSRSGNNPFEGLFDNEDLKGRLDAYLAKQPSGLSNIHDVETLKLRLQDISCSGCHQSRSIAGFHFIGIDRAGEAPTNSVSVAGSAHFFSDLPRRRSIVQAMAEGRTPAYARGFASRPLPAQADALARTQLYDGWGATCHANAANDNRFAHLACRRGLNCAVLNITDDFPNIGTCVSGSGHELGDPVHIGRVTRESVNGRPQYGQDKYDIKVKNRLSWPQEFNASPQSSGFPNGTLRLKNCDRIPPEATCGKIVDGKFTECINQQGANHETCMQENTVFAALRACDRENPCREDYICTGTYEHPKARPGKGTCVPTYFMFQFRADGHPGSFMPPVVDN